MSFESQTISEPGSYTIVSTNNYGSSTKTYDRTAAFGSVTRLSYQTPDFVKRLSTGELPENTFRYTEELTRNAKGHMIAYEKFNETRFSQEESFGVFGTPGIIDPMTGPEKIFLEENQHNAVLAKLLQKVKSSDIDLSVVTGEIRETANMFLNFAKVLNGAVNAIQQRDISALRHVLGFSRKWRSGADMWLLFSFGIKPLAMDLLGACKALEKGMAKETYHVVRARNKIKEVRIVSNPIDYGTDIQTWTYELETSGRLKYNLTNAAIATLSSLGLTNPFNAAWQLKRLSFVVDWAIGIGNWLSNLDSSFGKEFKQGSMTQFWRIEMVGRYERTKLPYYTYYHEEKEYGYHYVSCDREPFVQFPFQFLPVMKNPIGVFQAVSSLALAVQSRR